MWLVGCLYAKTLAAQLSSARVNLCNLASPACTRFLTAYSCAANPAVTCRLNGWAAGVAAERRFSLPALPLVSTSIGYGRGTTGVGIFAGYFGNPLYHSVDLMLSCSKQLGALAMGIAMSVNRFAIPGYAQSMSYAGGLYAVWNCNDAVTISLCAVNPRAVNVAREYLDDGYFAVGADYAPDESVCLSVNVRKPQGRSAEILASVQGAFGNRCRLKAGLLTTGVQPFLGIGWLLGGCWAECSLSYHPVLGGSPAFSLLYAKRNVE